ncbi:hypothetical protein HPT25_11155 [Bacillus sp. BRMEA1]|uniref:hypothetical protein n=1 Tax=Neobacillus endophyticus TaxID=2738405 RepID=UPI0015641F80|nr:hypothetical protein [Neobacillus endophyticus]NRD77941.1 hypothetical protein [Neobacillus endophyticus]
MYHHYFQYPVYPPTPPYSGYYVHQPHRPYPPVDTKIFASSIKSFRLLMEQGSILLDRLGDSSFAFKMMSAAQQGNKAEVDRLVKSVGLKVPAETKFTPSGVIFTLSSQTTQQQPLSCCTLAVSMKWGL